jgi:pantoate--beta-alanine ligase
MPKPPLIARSFASLVQARRRLAKRGATIALVPTMGALHDGHVSLVRLAKQKADKVIVSIFVNPTQFAAHEDLGSYPRTWVADIEKLTAEGADLVWNPSVQIMYPDGFATKVVPEGAALAGLEDKFRPDFFGGVATVVTKLFTQVRPDFAMFGQKDYQQLMVVTRMASDLDLGVKVVGAAIVRERDGLALSSRNVYLTPDQRRIAPVIFRTLKETAKQLRAGAGVLEATEAGVQALAHSGLAVDYLEARHARTLAPLDKLSGEPARLLVAAKLGTTRLIDNIKV